MPAGLAKTGKIQSTGDSNDCRVPDPDTPRCLDSQRITGTEELRFPSIGQFLIAFGFCFKLRRHFRDCVVCCGCQRPFQGDFQNFVHVADIFQLVVALPQEDSVPVVVNAFSDDTYEFGALAELIRPKLGSSSQIVDESYPTEGREPVFLNRIAKRLHPAQHEEAG